MNAYPDFTSIRRITELTEHYSALALENGCDREGLEETLQSLTNALSRTLEEVKKREKASAFSQSEPNTYEKIRSLCIGGNRPAAVPGVRDKIAGALLGRFAGCILGAPVEGLDIRNMEQMAARLHMDFPPTTYWREVERPWGLQFEREPRSLFAEETMDGVPIDDDITYPILSLLIMETCGRDFTTDDVGAYWKAHLTTACTAELAALENLKKGIPAESAADHDNPYAQWIGALIRADGFGYACAGNPELAANLGYRDAFLTHRRNGIYGEMLFAASIAAAFTVADPLAAVRMGLLEIPHTSALYRDVSWALEKAPAVTDYKQARALVDERFPGMNPVHTNNNACLIVFALKLGGLNLTETIANAVAMGLDNDCTAATCGSLVGAVVGSSGIPAHWTDRFHNKVRTYITGAEELSIEDVIDRFTALQQTFAEK